MSATTVRDLGASIVKPKSATIACRKCHERKVRCSGGQPCSNCRRHNPEAECSYPHRVRHVKVKQSYFDELLAEIDRLKSANASSAVAGGGDAYTSQGGPSSTRPSRAALAGSIPASSTNNTSTNVSDPHIELRDNHAPEGVAVRNPLLEDRPWFISLTPDMPVLVGEATDAAFATRFRQALSGQTQSHFPRTQYAPNPVSASLTLVNFPMPAPAKARFLTKIAFNTICRRYHFLGKKCFTNLLEQSIQNPAQCDAISTCKLFAVFALGEVYSARAAFPGAGFPGIDYYNNATHVLRNISEEPRIECVEILVMLVSLSLPLNGEAHTSDNIQTLYAMAMNRRHAAYCMAGSAMRFAISMGLHHNVPPSQLLDRELLEHRVRLWWGVYMLDRQWATLLGQPVSIRDEDIDVALPSSAELADRCADEFHSAEDDTASLRIARLSAEVTASIYGRNMQEISFSARVQQALKRLHDWIRDLPEDLLSEKQDGSNDIEVKDLMLQLYYNQCLCLVTRPILLHVFRLRHNHETGNSPVQPNEPTTALAEACVQSARQSFRRLADAWINGFFPTFDYALTQYLFSVCIILAISGLSQAQWPNPESEDFEAAVQILEQLSQSGSPAAAEFMRHVSATKLLMEAQIATRSEVTGTQSHIGIFNLTEPSLQDLMSLPNLDLDTLETPFDNTTFQSFFWPDTNAGTWTS